jgi:hypothetical protein
MNYGFSFYKSQTKRSMHCSSFMVGTLCLLINLHEAGRTEAGAVANPQATSQTAVLVMLRRDQLVYRFYRFFHGLLLDLPHVHLSHDRQFLVQSF